MASKNGKKKDRPKTEMVGAELHDPVGEQLAALRAIMPHIFTEGQIDPEKLRQSAGEILDDRPERYSFTWAGRRDAIRLLQTPTRATLIPCREESVNFDTTQHVFIEGDNLEVQKVIQKSFARRVKVMIIDPPYNTGKDFIYPDNFADPLAAYLTLTGQQDAEGNLLTSNPQTSGRFHSAWLNHIYPRLFVARQILREDGIIFVSIDDHEAFDLRLVMNEIFGEENFIAQLVWEKGRKNDAKLFSVGHEYMLVYARSLAKLKEEETVWREPKPGAKEIWEKYLELREKHGSKDAAIEEDIQEWYRQLPEDNPAKKLSRYKHVDKHGPWRDRDISWPGGGGPRYEVPHYKTKKACKVPERGWGFATKEKMEEQIRLGLVVFREDHTEPPFRKAHLNPIAQELEDDADAQLNGNGNENGNGADDSAEVGMQVMPSVIYKQSQVAVKHLRALMGAKVFDNPKDHEVLARLIAYVTKRDAGDIVLDFYGGSGSTGEAVLWQNHQDGGNRRFVLVQIPELTPEDSEARKAGFKTISQLTRARLAKVSAKLHEELSGQLDFAGRKTKEDIGFRVFKLAESNFRRWKGAPDNTWASAVKEMELFVDPLLEGWKADGVLYEVILREGFSLTSQVSPLAELKTNRILRVEDVDKGQMFLISLDAEIKDATLKALKLGKDDRIILRDMALTDTQIANLALQCRLKTI